MDRSFCRFVTIHACDRRTDRQTDRILIVRPRLHSMQRGKNEWCAVLSSLKVMVMCGFQAGPQVSSTLIIA